MLHSDRLRPRSREWEGTGQRQDYRLRKVVLLKFLTQT